MSSFQAVNPWKSSDLGIKGRNLPHLEVPEATYFVTFRCRKGLSLSADARDLAMSAIRHWDAQRIDLDTAVVKPDHVHAIFRIIDGSSLSQLLHSVKSFSSNQINKLLSRSGPFWLDESFDHIIRNATEWEEKAEYVRQNPVKKGLAEAPEDYPWLYVKGQEKGHRLEACATPKVEFEIFEPKSESEVREGTVTRGNATCPCCNTVLPVAPVRAQLTEQRGGADVIFDDGSPGILPGGTTGILPARTGGARLLAVVTLDDYKSGRQYRLPSQRDYEAVWKAQERLKRILDEWKLAQASSLRDTGKDASATLEEDARLTAFFLWTLQSTDKSLTTEDAESTEDETEDEDDGSAASGRSVVKGFTLIYDVARRFAQPLGIHLPNWEGRIIETKKGVVRLIPVLERAEQLFGEAGTESVARAIEGSGGQDAQYALFPDQEGGTGYQPVKGKRSAKPSRAKNDAATTARMAVPQATALDRVHAAMLLPAGGQATTLRAMLEAETERSPDFLRLANALSALSPKDSEEKRLLDAMLLAVRSEIA